MVWEKSVLALDCVQWWCSCLKSRNSQSLKTWWICRLQKGFWVTLTKYNMRDFGWKWIPMSDNKSITVFINRCWNNYWKRRGWIDKLMSINPSIRHWILVYSFSFFVFLTMLLGHGIQILCKRFYIYDIRVNTLVFAYTRCLFVCVQETLKEIICKLHSIIMLYSI